MEEVANDLAFKEAAMLDAELMVFLTEQGLDARQGLEEIKGRLKAQNMEVIHEVTKHDTSDVHTFKLCKVLAKKSINVTRKIIIS